MSAMASDQLDETSIKVWGVAVMASTQKAAVNAHCFGDCGKISMGGAINDDLTGGLFVCCEPTCPHTEKEIENYGETMSFERRHVVTLRILKDERHGE
ncbi:MAG: hypothetical protein E2576_11185 [Alcaligenaceae bacterium]|nr:hypothetical protein [Alcaligenaceae bacterium SAGV5]MPS51228.1 hypothetical protein [Alcaligenaceae bacterium SAGV3]MPT57275.1 hypothetical protein [Alcaligenaceae bacterium]